MIILYSCMSCQSIFDEALLRSGQHYSCNCGSRFFKQVNPTSITVLKYILGQPFHAIKRMLSRGM